MPRLALKMMKINDKHLYKAAEAVEVSSLAYVTATDALGSGADVMTRCAVAGVVFYLYSDFVDGMA